MIFNIAVLRSGLSHQSHKLDQLTAGRWFESNYRNYHRSFLVSFPIYD